MGAVIDEVIDDIDGVLTQSIKHRDKISDEQPLVEVKAV